MAQAGALVLTLRRVRSAAGNIQALHYSYHVPEKAAGFLVCNAFLFEVCFILDLACNLLACVLVIWIALPVHSDVHWISCLLGEFCTSSPHG